VFVGDSPMHDIAGSKAAGMFAVLTRQYVTRPTDGVDAVPDAVIDHLCEVLDVVRLIDERVGVARG
jgi:FMN phosphatase YigB (HAD superfamily)